MNDLSALPLADFRKPGLNPGPLSAVVAARLAASAGDVALVLDAEGRIADIALASAGLAANGFGDWVGQTWTDTVTIESHDKIAEMLAGAAAGDTPRWRQVNHPSSPGDIPIRYMTVGLGDGRALAIGRDLRPQAAQQQRLLQTQQSLEREYLRLRQAESRYRLLFDASGEAVLIVDVASRKVREANPAAYRLLGVRDGSLPGAAAGSLVKASDRDGLLAFLGAASIAEDVTPVTLGRALDGAAVAFTATLFRQDRATLLLVRMRAPDTERAERAVDGTVRDVVERMPDAFVLTDGDLRVVAANAAFVDLTEQPSAARVVGKPLGDWLGRPGIDLDLFVSQLTDHGSIRNVATVLRGSAGAEDEVELSAVAAPGGAYGFTIRLVTRLVGDTAPASPDAPRSVEQLTGLVGRMSLKDIVRESTDMIERLCIEAALAYTQDNRASAADILGLSRQSLYSKLHRHGLGNLTGSPD